MMQAFVSPFTVYESVCQSHSCELFGKCYLNLFNYFGWGGLWPSER